LVEYRNTMNKSFNAVACILPTAPLINAERLIEGYTLLINGIFKTVTPVVPFSYPIYRSLRFDENHHLKMNWPEYLTSRSQDLQPAYHDAGMFYWLDYKNFLIEQQLFSQTGTGLVLNETEMQDIDNETDWKLAELKYQLIYG